MKNSRWDHELESLGISVKKKNELNDSAELAGLVDSLKQVYLQDFKTAYSDDAYVDESHFGHLI